MGLGALVSGFEDDHLDLFRDSASEPRLIRLSCRLFSSFKNEKKRMDVAKHVNDLIPLAAQMANNV